MELKQCHLVTARDTIILITLRQITQIWASNKDFLEKEGSVGGLDTLEAGGWQGELLDGEG